MMNSFGRIFRVSIFGESHGSHVGIVVDGCPPGILLKPDDFTSGTPKVNNDSGSKAING